MKNFKAHLFAALALAATIYIGYLFAYEPFRVYEQDVLAITAGEPGGIVPNALNYAGGKLGLEQLALEQTESNNSDKGFIEEIRAFFGDLFNQKDKEKFAAKESFDELEVLGIIRIEEDDANLRTEPDPTADNATHTTNKGELYTYYDVEYYGDTPWYKVLLPDSGASEWRYISSVVSTVITDRDSGVTEDERDALVAFMDYTLEERKATFENYDTTSLSDYAILERNFANQVMRWAERSSQKEFEIDFRSLEVKDGLKVNRDTYWLRVEEYYEIDFESGNEGSLLESYDYIVKVIDDEFYISKWIEVHAFE